MAGFSLTPEPCTDYRNRDIPGCSQVQAVMNLTNQVNVPFDNYGYLQAKTQCMNDFSPFRSNLQVLPDWPMRFAKLYPTQDLTSEAFPLQPTPDMDINGWENTVAHWPPPPIPLDIPNRRKVHTELSESAPQPDTVVQYAASLPLPDNVARKPNTELAVLLAASCLLVIVLAIALTA